MIPHNCLLLLCLATVYLTPEPPDGRASNGQEEVSSKTLTEQLRKNVSIDADNRSAESIVGLIGNQAGVSIRLQNSLGERRLSLHIHSSPAHVVLDTLCEMEGWAQYESDGVIRLERPAPRPTSDPAQCAAAIRRSIPRDIVLFLRARLDATPDRSDGSSREGATKNWLGARGSKQRLNERFHLAIESLMRDLTARFDEKSAVAFSELSANERESLVWILFFRTALSDSLALFLDDFLMPKYVAKPELASIELKSGLVLVLHRTQEGNSVTGTGFGGVPFRP